MHQSSSGLASGRRERRRRKGRGIRMFKELLPLLEGRTMILTAAKIGDALTVTMYPKRNGEKDENPVGNTPLCVTGTAEELDHELPALIAGYAEELGKFHNNLGQIKQQLADAATAAAEAAKVKTGRKPAMAQVKLAAKSAEPAEPPVAGADLLNASMPPASAAPETQPARADTTPLCRSLSFENRSRKTSISIRSRERLPHSIEHWTFASPNWSTATRFSPSSFPTLHSSFSEISIRLWAFRNPSCAT